MTRRIVGVSLPGEVGLLDAVADLKRAGHRVHDVLGPYAVHGLSESLGQAPSRLPWVCLVAGLVGLAGGLLFQAWTSAVDWPVDVGGKPPFSWPAFVPVAFELTVLFAGLGTVAAFLLRERAKPLRLPESLRARATDDRFVIVVEPVSASYDAAALRERMREQHGAVEVEEVLVEEAFAQDGRVGPGRVR